MVTFPVVVKLTRSWIPGVVPVTCGKVIVIAWLFPVEPVIKTRHGTYSNSRQFTRGVVIQFVKPLD